MKNKDKIEVTLANIGALFAKIDGALEGNSPETAREALMKIDDVDQLYYKNKLCQNTLKLLRGRLAEIAAG